MQSSLNERTMSHLKLLIFLACVAGLHAGLVHMRSVKTCPPYTTKPDFEYLKYAGVWYEIQKIPNVFEAGLDCVRAIYDEIGPNEISVLNTGVFQSGELSNISGTGRQPRPDTEPGHLIVSFPGRPDGTYEVLDTDYENWTAVYSCLAIGSFNFEYAWLMGRSNTLSPELLGAAQAAYTRNGIDVNKFEFTVHYDTCNYTP